MQFLTVFYHLLGLLQMGMAQFLSHGIFDVLLFFQVFVVCRVLIARDKWVLTESEGLTGDSISFLQTDGLQPDLSVDFDQRPKHHSYVLCFSIFSYIHLWQLEDFQLQGSKQLIFQLLVSWKMTGGWCWNHQAGQGVHPFCRLHNLFSLLLKLP